MYKRLYLYLLPCPFFLACFLAAGPRAAGAQAPDDGCADGPASRIERKATDPWVNEEAAAVLYRPVETRKDDPGSGGRPIRVLVHYGRSEFFVANGKPWGVECEAFAEYEKFLNKSLRGRNKARVGITFIPVRFQDLIPYLLSGKGDIAAGLMTVTDERKQHVAFTEPYIENVSEVLVCHAAARVPKNLQELSGRKVHVLRGSSFAQHLRRLNGQLSASGFPPVDIVEMPTGTNADDILEMVNAGIFELTFVDDFIARLWSQVLPDIRVVKEVTLSHGGGIAWAVRPENPELLKSLNAFIDYASTHLQRKAAQVMKTYFKDTKLIKNPLRQELFGRVKTLGPHFREASALHKVDWLMMLSQGYQESELNQNLRSPRGAVGVMQILPKTAKSVGYRDVTKERQNIGAGVAYLDWIRKNYFNEPGIPPDARVDFALAAYNAGPGRIQGLREKAKERGLNPNLWFNNVERVALDEIGEEPVRYVANINRYYIAYRMTDEIEKERDLRKAPR